MDVLWQFAIFAALVHIVVMKVPEQADSALNIIPSGAVAATAFGCFLRWRAVPLSEASYLFGLFCLLFVRLSYALLTTVFVGRRSASAIQCILQTSRCSRVLLVYGHGCNLSQNYILKERVFQDQRTSETAKTSRAIGYFPPHQI
jgi:hypothetical protein